MTGGTHVSSPHRIGVIADDTDLRDLIVDVLEGAGHRVVAFARKVDALDGIGAAKPDAIVLDLGLFAEGGSAGWSYLRRLREHDGLGEIPVLVCTGDLRTLRDRNGSLAGDPRVATLPKPFDIEALETSVASLLDGEAAPSWDDDRDVVLVADGDARLIDASRLACAVLGVPIDELRGRSVADIVAPGHDWTAAEWDRFRRAGRWTGEVLLKSADGRPIPAKASAEILSIGKREWHVSRLELLEPLG